jgi:hypothetical protein
MSPSRSTTAPMTTEPLERVIATACGERATRRTGKTRATRIVELERGVLLQLSA